MLPCYRFDLPDDHPDNRDRPTFRYAVVDAVPVVHTRPLSVLNGNVLRSSFYRTFQLDPEREMRELLQRWGLDARRVRAPRVLRHVPVPVDYAYVPRDLPAGVAPFPRRRTAFDRTTLPVFLQSNVNRETRAVRRATPSTQRPRHDWTRYYYKLGYGFHARVRDNRLRVVKDLGSFQSRNRNTVQMLHEVLLRYTVPDTELLVCTDDKVRTPDHVDTAGVPILVMAKKPWQTYLTYPDHTFYGWPEAHTRAWETERAAVHAAASVLASTDKRDAAFFRGNLDTAYLRKAFAKSSSPVLDVRDVRVGAASAQSSFVTLAEHARYAYLLHIPGRSYAARLKYLLAAGSTVLYVRKPPKHEYREFWYDALVDGETCLVVRDTNRYDLRSDDPLPDAHGHYHDQDAVEQAVRAVREGRRTDPVRAWDVVRALEWEAYWARVVGELGRTV